MDQENNITETIEKYDIKLKSNPKDGVKLQLHHTIRQSSGLSRRIRFVTGSFNDVNEKLACADSRGNIFILDFDELLFWKLAGIGPCSAMHFVSEDTLLVSSTKNYEINLIDIETGVTSHTLTGHTARVKHMSCSNHRYQQNTSSKKNNLLTASSVEAILWDLSNYTKFFTLNTFMDAQIQQILFTPSGDYLVSCFQNNTVQIWKHENMKSIKQIVPNELKHMKAIAFTLNGEVMAMGGVASTLILLSMITWKVLKTIDLTKFNMFGAQQIAFVPQPFDGGANKVLAILSNDCKLHFLDLEKLNVICNVTPGSSGIKKFFVSSTGKCFACILQLGEVNIYDSALVLELAENVPAPNNPKYVPVQPVGVHHHQVATAHQAELNADTEQKKHICMDSGRLRRILSQYEEYPDKYRSIIWKSLLNTPKNKKAYLALVDMGIHTSYKDIEKQFTIHSSGTLNNLKRLLSCLSHWCPLFGVMKFLPGFSFPFVKVLQKDPLFLFECVATILINYCQLWFEYAPFPPVSVLAMIENILGDHDQILLDHYVDIGVTSQIYALKILETAFSEVLTCSDWLILWDHILSNEPAFMLMAVVAYSIVQRNAIKKLKTVKDIDKFFHSQNPIDNRTFLKKIYHLLNETSEDIHPRKFFKCFVPLEKGDCYQQFTAYPVATITLKLARNKSNNFEKKSSLKELISKSQDLMINERSKSDQTICDNNQFLLQDDSSLKKENFSCEKDENKGSIAKNNSVFKENIKDNLIKTVMDTLPSSISNVPQAQSPFLAERKDKKVFNLIKIRKKSINHNSKEQ